VRQAESKPLVDALRIWFDAQIAKLPARGPTAQAIRYALNHWEVCGGFSKTGGSKSIATASSARCGRFLFGHPRQLP
jgi:hypothetical protein